jgi:hypothetical protein
MSDGPKDSTPDPIDTDPDDLDAPVVVPSVVDAKAQERIGGPLPATIVGDKRDTRTKRLAWLGLAIVAIVLLGSGLNGIRSTNHRLHRAEAERAILIREVESLAATLHEQGIDLRALRQAIIKQNAILRQQGLDPIPVPSLTSEGGGASNGGRQSSTPRSPSPPGAPPPSPRPTHSPSAPPRPSPCPSPLVCLPQVGCLPRLVLQHMTVLDWETILQAALAEANSDHPPS